MVNDLAGGHQAWSRRPTTVSARLFLDLGPRILERDGAIEDRLTGSRIAVDAEVPETLELEAAAGRGGSQRRLELGIVDDFQRLRIEVGSELLALFQFARVFLGEELVVEPD